MVTCGGRYVLKYQCIIMGFLLSGFIFIYSKFIPFYSFSSSKMKRGTFRMLIFFFLVKNQGLKFSDLMYVTKRSMASAVSNLTKHLEQVSEALSVSAILLMISIIFLGEGVLECG
jgi:hypothetical protein